MHVVIFEGSHWTDLVPFTLTRPIFSLRSGASTLLEKQLRATQPTRLTLWIRPEMEGYVRQYLLPQIDIPVSINTPLDDEPALIFSGRTLHFAKIERPETECVVLEEEDRLIRLAYVTMPGLTHDDVMQRSERWLSIRELPHSMPQSRFPRHWADLISWNEESILADSIHWKQPPPDAARAHLVEPASIHAEADVSVGVNVVLDASKGPILIGAGASIGANSVIEGPCHIGAGARISPLSLIRPGTSIGPCCRVGGEVGNTIFQSYSNKSHDGFVGDSYIGEWVNLGAGTTTSNLKSTYGLIKLHLAGREVQSERVLLGSAIGDHAKTATNTQLVAGSYVGAASLVAITARVPHVVPSFSFWTDECRERTGIDKALEIGTRMQSRRSRAMCDVDRQVLGYAAKVAAENGY
jgi:UDP-N-acetylglucosamine diphosphorylase / glucose-1-phosphate thymidylyltransferase / UDP-N-acetylgalactosamine diphosphorylase / glucosamine-1-phosphate N-acetyltransferase / galactosamine-1-phosphate N-acetyltransferase